MEIFQDRKNQTKPSFFGPVPLFIFIDLCEKARIPRAFHEDEWPVGVWGSEPQAYEAFSKEEAPPCGRGSSLKQVRVLTQVFNFVI